MICSTILGKQNRLIFRLTWLCRTVQTVSKRFELISSDRLPSDRLPFDNSHLFDDSHL
jgi:hypothetical protein